ncbi:MAG: TetR/AcrR family transcriptional regulator [Gallionella sp.]
MSSKPTDIRQHILDIAKPLILRRGFSVVGLNDILCAAQVPKGSFYHYFKSKEAFGEALLECYFTDYLARLDKRLHQENITAAQCLMNYWTLWIETQSREDAEDKCLVVKLSAEVSDLSEMMRTTLQRGTNDIIARIANCIRLAITEGSFSKEINADMTAQTLYGMWLGATLLSKIRRDRSAFDGAMSTTLRLLNLSESRNANK